MNQHEKFEKLKSFYQTEPFSDRTYAIRRNFFIAALITIILHHYDGGVSAFLIKFEPSVASKDLGNISMVIMMYEFCMYIFYGYIEYSSWKSNIRNEVYELRSKNISNYFDTAREHILSTDQIKAHGFNDYITNNNNTQKAIEKLLVTYQNIDVIAKSIPRIDVMAPHNITRNVENMNTASSDFVVSINDFKMLTNNLDMYLTNAKRSFDLMTLEINNATTMSHKIDVNLRATKSRYYFKIALVDILIPVTLFIIALTGYDLGLFK